MKPALDLLRKRDNVFEKRGLVCAPVEVVEKRTERSKTFDLGNGTYHLSQSIGSVHYRDAEGKWQEIDLSFRFVETAEGAVWRMDKAAYICDVFTDRVGWRHTSREGWWRQCELVSVDGVPVVYDRLPRLGESNVVLYDGVTPDLDVKVVAFSVKSEKFHRPAKPMTLEWRVTASDGAGGVFQEKTNGWDGRGDTLEMVSKLDGERFTETWTGRVSRVVDRRTRRKAWSDDPEYPVLIDASITENIEAGADDGFSTPYTWSAGGVVIAGRLSARRNPGFRFQNMALPSDVTIDTATCTLNITQVNGSPVGHFYADDVDSAVAWSYANKPIGIAKTAAFAYVAPTVTDSNYTFNVASIIAEVAARAGWASNNAMRFGLLNADSSGINTWRATAKDWVSYFNRSGVGAQLDITYTLPTNIVVAVAHQRFHNRAL